METFKQKQVWLAAVLQQLSTEEALQKLAGQHGRRQAVIVRNGLIYTVGEALQWWSGCVLDMPCHESGLIQFYGGPPGKPQWFTGTVFTMLADATLFHKHYTGGLAEALSQ